MNRKGFASIILILVLGILVGIGIVLLWSDRSTFFKQLIPVTSNSNNLDTHTPGQWCRTSETQLVLINNEPQQYKGLMIENLPWKEGYAYVSIDTGNGLTSKNVVMGSHDKPIVFDTVTIRVPDVDSERAIVCVSDTKIKFQDIVTPLTVDRYLPPVRPFDWEEGLKSTKGWKTYANVDIGISFKYPSTWYGKDPLEDPADLFVDTPCHPCGGIARGLSISKNSNEDNLSPKQLYVKINCGYSLSDLLRADACQNVDTEYSIEDKPKSLEGYETYIENGSPGAGDPGIDIIFKNKKGELIGISADGVDDDVMKTILHTLVVN